MNNEVIKIENGGGSMMTLKGISDRVNMVHQVMERVMKEGTHYGRVPGCGQKQVLFKPGADVLAMTFRLVPQFKVDKTEMENGHREYDVTCTMFAADGSMLGQGVGSGSTMEAKYRYRKDHNGKKIENEDIADVYNTVLKMAKKRALIDATLTVTGAADMFTQDLIEDDEAPAREPIKEPQAKQPSQSDDLKAISGIIEDVAVKTEKPDGSGWKKYGIVIGGKTYGTFSESLGMEAQERIGKQVNLQFKNEGKYFNAIQFI